MMQRQLGWSDLKISPLVLGGNIFGHFCDAGETRRILDMAFDHGINGIDTADAYSDGLSETIIGMSVPRSARSQWVIATKFGMKSGENPDGQLTRSHIFERVEKSLKRLKTDYVDLYQMHHYDAVTPLEETFDALDRLVKSGKIRHYGVSNYSAAQLQSAIEVSERESLTPLASIQSPYNLFKREMENLFPVIDKKSLGVFAYCVLARGILTGKYSEGGDAPADSRAVSSASIRSDLQPQVLAAVRNLSDYAESNGYTVRDLAIQWVLRKKQVSAAVIGVRNISQLQLNIKSLRCTIPEEILEGVDRVVGDLQKFDSACLGSFSFTKEAKSHPT